MVLRKRRQVIVAAAADPDQRNSGGIQRSQLLTVADGYQPVAGTMQDISMTIHFADPLIGTEMETQHQPHGQERQETLNRFSETVIRCIQNQIAGPVITGYFGGETTAQAPAIYQDMIFRMHRRQGVVYKLHIAQHIVLTPFAGAFSKTPVIHQYHIISELQKITGIFCPALDTAGIAMKIQYEPLWFGYMKMKAVDTYSRRYIKKEFFERKIILVLEIMPQFLRLKNQPLLQEVGQQKKQEVTGDDIEECGGQGEFRSLERFREV